MVAKTKVVKKKPILKKASEKKSLPPIDFDENYNVVKKFVKSNEDKYLLLASNKSDNYFIMIHKKELTTKEVNDNNPFQPYEKIETKNHAIAFVVWISYTREEPEFIKEMKKFNANILRLTPLDDFEERIKGLCEKKFF